MLDLSLSQVFYVDCFFVLGDFLRATPCLTSSSEGGWGALTREESMETLSVMKWIVNLREITAHISNLPYQN